MLEKRKPTLHVESTKTLEIIGDRMLSNVANFKIAQIFK